MAGEGEEDGVEVEPEAVAVLEGRCVVEDNDEVEGVEDDDAAVGEVNDELALRCRCD